MKNKNLNLFGGIINFKVFLLSLAIGMFYVYIMSSPKKVLVIYPIPGSHTTQYVDDANNCYEFEAKKVNCSKSKNVKDIPINKKENVKI